MNWSMRKVKTRKTSDFPGKSGSLVCNEYITPAIIKFPFWKYTRQNSNAFYACINLGEAGCSREIVKQSICIDADIGKVLEALGSCKEPASTGFIG